MKEAKDRKANESLKEREKWMTEKRKKKNRTKKERKQKKAGLKKGKIEWMKK